VQDALALTGYVIHIAPNEQKTFGYGGEDIHEKVDVLFQSRNISNVSFAILRNESGQYKIEGRDDQISIYRKRYSGGEAAILNDGDTFTTIGPLGQTIFTVSLDKETDGLIRLNLRNPIFLEIRDSPSTPTRLVIGPFPRTIASPIDEIFIRTQANESPNVYRAWVTQEGLRLEEEQDLAENAAPSTRPTSQMNITLYRVESGTSARNLTTDVRPLAGSSSSIRTFLMINNL